MFDFINESRKALVSAIGTVLSVVIFTHNFDSFLHGNVCLAVGLASVVLTPVATWLVPNKAKESLSSSAVR
jgi:hypothetical protein